MEANRDIIRPSSAPEMSLEVREEVADRVSSVFSSAQHEISECKRSANTTKVTDEKDLLVTPLEVATATLVNSTAETYLRDSPRPSGFAHNTDGNEISITKKDTEKTERMLATPEEKTEFAVILAEQIADEIDSHQSHAAQSNPYNLLSSCECILRFRIIFLAVMDSSIGFPLEMATTEAHDFLRGVQFSKNHLGHLTSRTYRSSIGSTIATATAPSTPGIGGWIQFVEGNRKIRKSNGYGDETVQEMVRRGTKEAVFPERSPSFPGSQLTPARVRSMKRRQYEREQHLTEEVIREFRERNSLPRQEITVPPAPPMRTPMPMPGGYVDATGFSYSSYPANLPARPPPPQAAPGYMSSFPSNPPFTTPLGQDTPDSASNYHLIDDNAREDMRYYGTGASANPFSPPPYSMWPTGYRGAGGTEGIDRQQQGQVPRPTARMKESQAPKKGNKSKKLKRKAKKVAAAIAQHPALEQNEHSRKE